MTTGQPARSVGVVVAFADRDPQSVIHLFRTLAAQTRRPEAVVLLNFGAPCPRLARVRPPFPYIYRHAPHEEPWSIPRARNQGARLLPPVESVLFLDADLLLAPDVIARGLRHLKPGVLINCRLLDLPRGAVSPETDVVGDFGRLRELATLRREITAVGACQWVRTKAFHALRGHDEEYRMWCFEDMDFQRRARWLGLQPVSLDVETAILHQWHRSKDDVLREGKALALTARIWYRRNLSRLRLRGVLWDIGKYDPREINPRGWGKLPPPEEPPPATC